MFRFFKILIFLNLFFVLCENILAQNILDERITLEIQNQSIENILNKIQLETDINFSYSKNIVDLTDTISVTLKNVRLEDALIEIFKNEDIVYTVVSGLIVLRKKPQNIDNIKVKGKIYDANKGVPLEFAGLQLMNTTIGTITNSEGEFAFSIKKNQLGDTLLISALGYERQNVVLSIFFNNPDTVIYMKTISILIDEVTINAADYQLKTIGNNKKISFGSFYIDTHGQQTALFVENEDNDKGRILAVNYYLSKKGNTTAPFRVRLYQLDSLGNPGKDLLPDVLIAKPKFDGGWFTVNLTHYNIQIPENGFFVAIEGIYPVEKEAINEFGDMENDDFPLTVSYGQQLGYSRKKGNNTWHYSLAHTWFQLKEDNYNVMISVDVMKMKKNKN